MANDYEIKELPFQKESLRKWSFFNTYSIKTLRDLFVYVAANPSTEKEIFKAMENEVIKPPKNRWTISADVDTKSKDRQKLEYLHGAHFLGLIKQDNSKYVSDLDEFQLEKEQILSLNKHRDFNSEKSSPELMKEEKRALLPVILDYKRAKEYLWWFLDFKKFVSSSSFDLDDFKRYGQPIYLKKGKEKASEVIFRSIDKRQWKVPFHDYEQKGKLKRTDDYTRSITYIFPKWFEDLELINRLPIIREFDFIEGNWELHYPIQRLELNIEEFENFILEKFNNDGKKNNVVWMPHIIYQSALEFHLPVKEIKALIVRLYEEKRPKYTMERSSLQVMRYSSQLRNRNRHQELFINYREFNRNNLIINN